MKKSILFFSAFFISHSSFGMEPDNTHSLAQPQPHYSPSFEESLVKRFEESLGHLECTQPTGFHDLEGNFRSYDRLATIFDNNVKLFWCLKNKGALCDIQGNLYRPLDNNKQQILFKNNVSPIANESHQALTPQE